MGWRGVRVTVGLTGRMGVIGSEADHDGEVQYRWRVPQWERGRACGVQMGRALMLGVIGGGVGVVQGCACGSANAVICSL